MSFLGSTCVNHGQQSLSTTDACCAGLNPWIYDANTGTANSGFMCWSASCASAGQWAGPNGVGDHCCSPLVNVGGRCTQPTSSGGGSGSGGGGGGSTLSCTPIGHVPLAGEPCCIGFIQDSNAICNCPPGTVYDSASQACMTPKQSCSGTLICSIPDMYLYVGVGLLAVMMVMGKKKA